MRTPTGLALVLSLLVSITETLALNATVAPSSSISTSLKWAACQSSSNSETDIISLPSVTDSKTSSLIECAKLTVPVCYDGVNSCSKGRNMTQTLQLSRLATATAADAPTLWITQDALLTGQSADHLMTRITQYATSNVNVYALESRLYPSVFVAGDSKNSTLPCSSLVADYGTRPLVDSSFVTAQASCKAWIQSTFGDDGINAYSLDSAAKDLALAMSIVQTQEKTPTTSPLYVYASGRATRVVHRMLSQTKASITTDGVASSSSAVSMTGVVLDSPFSTPVAEKPVGDATNRFVSACATDPLCKSKFKDASLADVITQIYSRLNNSVPLASLPALSANASSCIAMLRTAALKDARDLTASHGVRRLLSSVRRSISNGGHQAIPALVYRVARCSDTYEDKDNIEDFLTQAAFTNLPLTSAGVTAGMAAFVDTVVTASELWPTSPEPTLEQLTADFRASLISDGLVLQRQPSYCAYSASQSTACQALYKPGVGSTINSSLSLVYKPSAKATDTSMFSNTDVLVFASRLSTTGSSTAATQLYDALLSQKKDSETLVMVQSDRLDEVALTSAMTDVELRLLGQFLSGKSRGLSGAWLNSDLTGFDWSATPPAVGKATSTVVSSVSTVNFTMSASDSFSWFSGSDPYEAWIFNFDDDWSVGSGMVVPIVCVVVVVIALVIVGRWRDRCRRSRWTSLPQPPVAPYCPPSSTTHPNLPQRPVSPIPLAVLVYPASVPDLPNDTPQLFPSRTSVDPSAEPWGLQPLQWEADHANEYALSYTPRDRNTLITEF